jgi:hypothetical protein
MKIPRGGTGYSAVGTDEAAFEAELLGHRHREAVPASGDENDVDTCLACSLKRRQIGLWDVQCGVDESAIDVHGNQANRRRH